MSIQCIIIIMTFILKLVQVLAFVAALVHTQPSQSCQAQWQLPSLIQFPRTLQITSPADQINEQYDVTFAGSYFQAPPQAIISTPHLDVSSFTDIDYRIIPQVHNTSATVTFLSNGMTWVQIKITLWLTSRADMFVGTIVAGKKFNNAENSQLSRSNNQTILQIQTSSPVYFFEDNRTIYLNYINGIQASSSQRVYGVNLKPASKSQTTYSLAIQVNPATTLTYLKVDYIIYNTQISLFSSGGGYYTSSNIVGPYHQKIHKTFLPIEYKLLGFQSFRISNQSQIKLDVNIDEDTILQISGDLENSLSYGRIVYLTIGRKSVDVCAACPELYIYQKSRNCIPACPDDAYPFSNYTAGGKSCLTCSAKVFEIINPQKTGCMCIAGYRYNSQGVCVSAAGGTIISGGSSGNISSSFTNTSSVTVSEDIITTTTETTTSSSSNSSNSTTSIIINPISVINCTGNSIPLFDGTCFTCPDGFYKKNNIQCVPCMLNCLLCSSLTTCAQCQSRYIANSDRTQCIPSSVICQPGFYKVNENCIQCPTGCAACSSPIACTACLSGFNFNPANLTCTRSGQISCPNNSILTADGQCVCDEFSMAYEDGCIRCVRGSFLNANKICVSCEIQNCQLCRTQFVCEECNTNYTVQSNGQCLYNASSNTICNSTSVYDNQKQSCIQCPNGSLKQGNTCQACPGEGCIRCTTLEFCDSCVEGLILTENRKNCKCAAGQYYSNSVCLPCVEGCISCLNGQSCQTCQNGLVFSQSENKCVVLASVSCGAGQYYSNSVCLPCVEGCISCLNGQSCQTCQNGWVFSQSENKCVVLASVSCGAGQYYSNSVCLPCVEGCISCLNGQSCQTCQNGWVFSQSENKCVVLASVSCGAGQYYSNSVCLPCVEGCISCLNGQSCQTCQNGWVFSQSENKCVVLASVSCGAGQYYSNSVCLPCVEGCISCLNGQSCQTCQNGWVFSQSENKCVVLASVSCGAGQYYSNSVCLPCVEGCISCLNGQSCQTCQNGWVFSQSENKCVVLASVSCGAGQYYSNSVCLPCVEGCISCLNGQSCQTCQNGWVFSQSENKCVVLASVSCGAGQYYSNSVCLPCVEGCISCLNGQSCQTCQNGWVFSQSENKCVVLASVSCGAGQYYSNSVCLPCVEGCISCLNGQSCQTCQNDWVFSQSENKCTQSGSCPAGATLTNGTCVCLGQSVLVGSSCEACSVGTFKNGNTCVKCIQGCVKCQSNNSCQACNGYLSFNSSSIACECQAPNYNIEGSCGPCPPGTVYSSSTMLCVDPNSIGNNSQCQPNYYLDGGQCLPCMINCSKCVDNMTCTQCIPPYQFSSESIACVLPPQCPGINQEFLNGECICNNRSIIESNENGILSCRFCGDNYFPNVDKTNCGQCLKKCLVCYDSVTCETCEEGYAGNDCRSCAANHTNVNGYCVADYCGNGIIDSIKDKANENCDDKNKQSGDGCSNICRVENGYSCFYNTTINASSCSHLFKLSDSSVTSSGIFLNFEDLNDKPNEVGRPQIVEGPVPSHIYEKVDPENPNKKVFFLDYCGVLPPENVTILTMKSGSQSAQYELKYDLLNMMNIKRS